MKFIVDENLPPKLAAWLRERGHDAVHVRDSVGLGSQDASLVDLAQTEGRIIVTKDGDFDPPRAKERVLNLRVGNCATSSLLAWLEPRLDAALQRLAAKEIYVALD